jgi:hypothetical protein
MKTRFAALARQIGVALDKTLKTTAASVFLNDRVRTPASSC